MKKVPIETKILVMNINLQKVVDMVQHIDVQTNIMIAFSSAIFLFSITKVIENGLTQDAPLMVLTVFSGFSAVTALLAVHPPRFLRKRKQPESLFYHSRVKMFPSSQAYYQELTKVLNNQDLIELEYAKEIFNLSKYYYSPKRELFKASRNLLFVGFVLSLTVYLLTILFY